ncbi:MAG TPA: hypothetical protein VGD80_24330, partial [Kofleriaceae bacterium]
RTGKTNLIEILVPVPAPDRTCERSRAAGRVLEADPDGATRIDAIAGSNRAPDQAAGRGSGRSGRQRGRPGA